MSDAGPTWSYEPGEHLAVLGARLAVVLPGDRRDLAARLWVLVDGGGDLLDVADALAADALAAGGLATLTGAVVVSWDGGDRATVLVRGTDPRVVVSIGDGAALVDGAAARTWVERTFEGVRSVSVAAGDGPAAAREADDAPVEGLVLAAGLVRVTRVARTTFDRSAAPPTETVPDAPVEPPTIPPGDQPTELHPAIASADTPAGPGGDPDPAGGAPRLRVSDGREVVVDAVVVVGRSPGPRDRHAASAPRLLRLDSPQQEISSTHLEVRPGTGPDTGSAVVTDLGSTNGTVVEHPGGAPEALAPGVGVALGPGAVVHVGDGVTLRLLGPDA